MRSQCPPLKLFLTTQIRFSILATKYPKILKLSIPVLTVFMLAGLYFTKHNSDALGDFSDCEVALLLYNSNIKDVKEHSSFHEFLEVSYRVGNAIPSGGFLRNPRYSVAIYIKAESTADSIDFRVSKNGKIHSERYVNIGLEAWSRHRAISCS